MNYSVDSMELDHTNTGREGPRENLILCCQCGTPIPPNPANTCVNCIKSQVDITADIQKQLTVHWCKNCNKYLQPPNSWVQCEMESRELLALLLKRLKLASVRLVDASFLWTEPHSRRIRIKITVQKEVFASTILQQSMQVEYVMSSMMCNNCMKLMSQNTWAAVVQARQKVPHKKTFLFLEQLILKHQAHTNCLNVKGTKDGLDFFFGTRPHALQFLQFLQSCVPLRTQSSEQIISSDVKSSTAVFKYTFTAEIVPICKNDLLCLPVKLARQSHNINPLCLCLRISGSVIFVLDVRTGLISDISGVQYWRTPFPALMDAGASGTSRMSEYYVMNIEYIGKSPHSKYHLADITVCKCIKVSKSKKNALAEDDLEIDTSQTYITRSHLGSVLKEGDYVYGYDLTNVVFNNEHFDEYIYMSQQGKVAEMPDVLLVKKLYFGSKSKGRMFRMKRLKNAADSSSMDVNSVGESEANEWEEFLDDLEGDKELREMVNLYKNPKYSQTERADSSNPDSIALAELMEDLDIDTEAGPDE